MSKRNKPIVIHGLIAWLCVATSVHALDYFVSPNGDDGNPGTLASPYATITHARDVVAQVNGSMSEDITVHLRGGIYALSSPLVFDEDDSGQNGHQVIYKAMPGETPIVSGGQRVTGWTVHDAGNNIYKASVAGLEFRQIYVDGTRGIRARYPNRTNEVTLEGYFTGATVTASSPHQLQVNAAELTGWETWDNLSEVEVVMVTHWKQKRGRIGSISGGTISFQSPENSANAMHHLEQGGTPHWYENAYEFLDAEGEFYLNTVTDTLYYKPRAGEDMASVEVIVPTVQTLLELQGSSFSSPVQDLVFDGITFQYSNWTEPNQRGYTIMQSATHYGNGAGTIDGNVIVPGAIQLSNANDIEIRSCTIRRTGANGIVAADDVVSNCIFVENHVVDIAGGGIYLLLNDANSTGNAITDNTVEYIGMVYSDGCGIFAARTPNLSILHNEVRHVRYTGISTGWEWNDNDTTAINHDIGYNLIHRTMGLHDDGGGIYTLGKIPGMNIHHNYIHSINRSVYAGNYGICGVYLDNGSSFKTVQYNVIDDVEAAFFAGNSPNHDNTFQWNYYNGTFANSMDAANTVQNNTIVTGSNWPAAALDIIANAGPRNAVQIEPVFADFFDDPFSATSNSNTNAGSSFATSATSANDNVSNYIVTDGTVGHYHIAGTIGNPSPALDFFPGQTLGTGALYLNLATVPYATYRVSLETRRWGAGGNVSYTLSASAFDGADTTSGTPLGSDIFSTATFSTMGTITFTFQAQSASTTLYIAGTISNTFNQDVWVDNIDIDEALDSVPVPPAPVTNSQLSPTGGSITWASSPGKSYKIMGSLDLANFAHEVATGIDASAGSTTSHSFSLPVTMAGSKAGFFYVMEE